VACESGRGEHCAGTESKTLLLDRHWVHELDTATDATKKKPTNAESSRKKLRRSPVSPKPRKSCSRSSRIEQGRKRNLGRANRSELKSSENWIEGQSTCWDPSGKKNQEKSKPRKEITACYNPSWTRGPVQQKSSGDLILRCTSSHATKRSRAECRLTTDLWLVPYMKTTKPKCWKSMNEREKQDRWPGLQISAHPGTQTNEPEKTKSGDKNWPGAARRKLGFDPATARRTEELVSRGHGRLKEIEPKLATKNSLAPHRETTIFSPNTKGKNEQHR
jgi:hypothetical protein